MDIFTTTVPEETPATEPDSESVRTVLPREMLSIERRHYSRRDYRTTITVFLVDDEPFAESSGPVLAFSAMSCNVSQGGMCFRCPQHLTTSRMVLRFRLPEQLYTLVEAEIVHSRQEDDGDWIYGVAFRRLLPDDWPLSADHAARDDVPSPPSV